MLSMLSSALFALTRDHGARHDDFSSPRLCRSAGDAISAELEREFTALSGLVIDEAYGMTEVGLVTVSPPSGRIKLGSVGQVVPAVSLSIRNDDGEESLAGSEGRRGSRLPRPLSGTGTTGARPRRLSATGGSTLASVMRADDEGYFFFRGGKKQIIVHDGSNIAPRRSKPPCWSTWMSPAPGDRIYASSTVKTSAPNHPRRQDGASDQPELVQFARARVGYKAPRK